MDAKKWAGETASNEEHWLLFREPRPGSQHPRSSPQPSLIPLPGTLFSWPLRVPGMYMMCRQIYGQNTHIH